MKNKMGIKYSAIMSTGKNGNKIESVYTSLQEAKGNMKKNNVRYYYIISGLGAIRKRAPQYSNDEIKRMVES